METLIIILVVMIILILLIWIISTINKINKALIKVEEAASGIDVALTKRYDLLTKMIDVVKSYTKHEKETLFEVVKIRNNMTIDEKNEINEKMNHNLDQIKIIAENYPELRSSENYNTLQTSISNVENDLQNARKIHNSNVSIYNQLIVTFPNIIVAKLKGAKPQKFFEAEKEKTKDIKIDL